MPIERLDQDGLHANEIKINLAGFALHCGVALIIFAVCMIPVAILARWAWDIFMKAST